MAANETSADRRIDYIEFTVSDLARTKAFYAEAFDWTYTDFGPSYTEFTDGRMKGGFDASEPVRAGGPLVVLFGDDLAALAARVERAGGRIVKPIFEFPGGRRFHFCEPSDNEFAVWSPVTPD